MGRLVADPEIRHTPSDVAVTSFALAVDRAYVKAGTERQADFIDCVAWRNTAEFICKHFRKGQMMAIKGSIQTRTYTSGSDDSKRKATEIMVSDVSFCGSKRESEGGNYQQSAPVPPQQGTYASAAPFIEDDNPVFASDEYEPIEMSSLDLPF
jgi:single-strand DNA-binding protein